MCDGGSRLRRWTCPPLTPRPGHIPPMSGPWHEEWTCPPGRVPCAPQRVGMSHGKNEHAPRLALGAPEKMSMSHAWPWQLRSSRDMSSPNSEAWTYPPYAHSLPRKMSMFRGKNGHVPRLALGAPRSGKNVHDPRLALATPKLTGHVLSTLRSLDISPMCPLLATKNEHVPRLALGAPEKMSMNHAWPWQLRSSRDMSSPHSEAWTFPPCAHSLPRKMSMFRVKNGHVPRTGCQPTRWHKKWTCPRKGRACPFFVRVSCADRSPGGRARWEEPWWQRPSGRSGGLR